MDGVKGLILGGKYGEVLARQKSGDQFEIGELLIAQNEDATHKVLCQVYDLSFGSQISQQNRELVSGIALEEDTDFEFMDKHLREYTLATIRELLTFKDGSVVLAKGLPEFFSQLRKVRKEDFSFFATPKNALYFGELRSGSEVLPVPIHLDGKEVLSHHVLIPATTGRGKSNFLKVLLWKKVSENYAGMLVLDPHDEYYRPEESLQAHPSKERVHYYSPNPLPGTNSLVFDIYQIKPQHFNGAITWSDAQRDVVTAYYKKYKKEWIEAAILEKEISFSIHEGTLNVVKRRLLTLLNLEIEENAAGDVGVVAQGSFRFGQGSAIINDVLTHLEKGEMVIVDTSMFSDRLEILVGSIFSSELLNRYKRYKLDGTLDSKPVVSIVLEEAPRVLGKEVLEQGSNIFSSIAREGRKFKVGLVAITQLPSLIPRQILANMNTKVILGIEMRPERAAIIESASQDLSKDERAIASLDKGEAIITTNFSPFAVPIKIPLFSDIIAKEKKEPVQKSFHELKN